MDYQTDLAEHNSRNYAILDRMVRLLGKNLTPVQFSAQMAAITRFKTLLIKPVNTGASQDETAHVLAGLLGPERQAIMAVYNLQHDIVH